MWSYIPLILAVALIIIVVAIRRIRRGATKEFDEGLAQQQQQSQPEQLKKPGRWRQRIGAAAGRARAMLVPIAIVAVAIIAFYALYKSSTANRVAAEAKVEVGEEIAKVKENLDGKATKDELRDGLAKKASIDEVNMVLAELEEKNGRALEKVARETVKLAGKVETLRLRQNSDYAGLLDTIRVTSKRLTVHDSLLTIHDRKIAAVTDSIRNFSFAAQQFAEWKTKEAAHLAAAPPPAEKKK